MVGREMQLTQKARELIEPIEQTLSGIETILSGDEFDPRESEQHYVIATADYVTCTLIPKLVDRVHKEAPKVTIQIVDIAHSVVEELRLGAIDFMIGLGAGMPKNSKLKKETVLEDKLVCIARADHPEIGETLDKETFLSIPHASFRMSREVTTTAEQIILDRLDIHPHNAILIPNFTLLPLIVEQTDCITLVHERIARSLGESHNIKIYPTPFDVPDVSVSLFWNEAQTNERPHKWLRELVLEIAAEC